MKSFWIFGAIVISAALAVGCGVRGRPQAPEKSSFIGRGTPTFPSATENLIDGDKKKNKNKTLEDELKSKESNP